MLTTLTPIHNTNGGGAFSGELPQWNHLPQSSPWNLLYSSFSSSTRLYVLSLITFIPTLSSSPLTTKLLGIFLPCCTATTSFELFISTTVKLRTRLSIFFFFSFLFSSFLVNQCMFHCLPALMRKGLLSF